MKKILVAVVTFVLVGLVSLAPNAQAEKESKSTTPVVAAVPLDYYRQMEQEKVSRERIRAAVVKHQAQQAKIAKAKKVAAAKKRAKVLAERKRQARLAYLAAQRAAKKKAEAQRIAKQAQRPKQIQKPSNTVNAPAKTYSGGSAKAYALSLVGAAQFACLEPLWAKESGWNYRAANPSSGAYGIPQALPGSKMASAGSDWATNPLTQIRWGVSYIQGRYGSPCAAWSHSQSVGWY